MTRLAAPEVGTSSRREPKEDRSPVAGYPREPPGRPPRAPVNRFRTVALVATLAAAVPYLWALWDLWTGTVDPLRLSAPKLAPASAIYDVQARALLHGHLSLPTGSIFNEAFISHGRTYTYFGIFPSLIRMPVLLATHSLDGHLTALSLLLAWLVTALFTSLLVWRLRVGVRGDAALGWAEVSCYGALIFSVLAGSVLVVLASAPNVYNEDEVWGAALACASLFALLGIVEGPTWWRVAGAGFVILLTNLNRATTGYACVLAALVLAGWLALGRGGADRRRWALPVLAAGLVPLAAGCAIDVARFGQLFGFPASEQLVYRSFGFRHINGGKYFSLHFLPTTVNTYLSPGQIRLTPSFPFVTLPPFPFPTVAHTQLFLAGPTASATGSMPMFVGLSTWGVIASFLPHRSTFVRSFRVLLVCIAGGGASVFLFGVVYERYLGDLMPILILGASIGMVDVWTRLSSARRRTRVTAVVAVGVLAVFGFVANMGIASTPITGWSETQTHNFVEAQRAIGGITGASFADDVLRTNSLPSPGPIGQFVIVDHCRGLYLSDGDASFDPTLVWLPVESRPNGALCRSLLPRARNTIVEARIVQPGDHTTVSGLVSVVTTAPGSRPHRVSVVLTSHAIIKVVGRAIDTRSGWIVKWDSRSVPNGTYDLRSAIQATGGRSGTSPTVTVTVDNPP